MRAHRRRRELDAADHTVQVHLELSLGGRLGLLVEVADPHHAGVVDQDIQRAQGGLDRGEERGERTGVRHIQIEGSNRAGQFACGCAHSTAIAVTESHPGTLECQLGGDLPADTACRTGHRDDASGQWMRSHGVHPPPRWQIPVDDDDRCLTY